MLSVRADGFVLAPLLVPDSRNANGDCFDAQTIERVAHDFVIRSRTPGIAHVEALDPSAAELVESYVTRAEAEIGAQQVKAGSWLVGFRVHDLELRALIRDREIRGVSMHPGMRDGLWIVEKVDLVAEPAEPAAKFVIARCEPEPERPICPHCSGTGLDGTAEPSAQGTEQRDEPCRSFTSDLTQPVGT